MPGESFHLDEGPSLLRKQQYAQWRYHVLTGTRPPAAGGKTYENMTQAERAADYRARMEISRELGHNRLEVTDVYLGRRFAGKVSS